MPHFENLDQYEAKNPKSGEKEIIPIAPHSMQAVDYRPHKRDESRHRPREQKPAFEPVEFDPISVRQMEKEFKQAARADARRNPGEGLRGIWKKLRRFLAERFGKRKKPIRGSRPLRRKPGGKPTRKPRPASSEAEAGQGPSRNRGPRRNRPPRDRSKDSKGPREREETSQPKGETSEKPSGSRRRSRNRRGKRSPGGPENRSGGPDRQGEGSRKPKPDS